LFGLNAMRNFNFPYFSRDIAEFWRRWHISLTTWFRDYVYIPLGGSRVSKAKIILNTFIIFLISGFWHGANWTFIAWGAYHALLFLPLILLGKNRKNTDTVANGKFFPKLKEIFQMFLTFFLVAVGWIIFRAENIGQAFEYFSKIFSSSILSYPSASFLVFSSKSKSLILILIITIFLFIEWIQRNKQHGLDLTGIKSHTLKFALYYLLLAMIFFYGGESETFIYFQF